MGGGGEQNGALLRDSGGCRPLTMMHYRNGAILLFTVPRRYDMFAGSRSSRSSGINSSSRCRRGGCVARGGGKLVVLVGGGGGGTGRRRWNGMLRACVTKPP